MTRIELATTAWKAVVLPLNYTRMAVWTGLEPATSCVTGRHSNQLNYQTSVSFKYKYNHSIVIAGAGFEPTTFGL